MWTANDILVSMNVCRATVNVAIAELNFILYVIAQCIYSDVAREGKEVYAGVVEFASEPRYSIEMMLQGQWRLNSYRWIVFVALTVILLGIAAVFAVHQQKSIPKVKKVNRSVPKELDEVAEPVLQRNSNFPVSNGNNPLNNRKRSGATNGSFVTSSAASAASVAAANALGTVSKSSSPRSILTTGSNSKADIKDTSSAHSTSTTVIAAHNAHNGNGSGVSGGGGGVSSGVGDGGGDSKEGEDQEQYHELVDIYGKGGQDEEECSFEHPASVADEVGTIDYSNNGDGDGGRYDEEKEEGDSGKVYSAAEIMNMSAADPRVLVGWRINVHSPQQQPQPQQQQSAGSGTGVKSAIVNTSGVSGIGVVLCTVKRKFATTKFSVEMEGDGSGGGGGSKVVQLALKRSATKGSVPFTLVEKVKLM